MYPSQHPFSPVDHPAESTERHQDDMYHRQHSFPTPCESPPLDWPHAETLGSSGDFPVVEQGTPNCVGQTVMYQRPVQLPGGLPSPSYHAQTANFNILASRADTVPSTWPLGIHMSAPQDQTMQGNYFPQHPDIPIYPVMEQFASAALTGPDLNAPWANHPSTSLGQVYGGIYHVHPELPAVPEPFSSTFVHYIPPEETLGKTARVKEEPHSNISNQQVDTRPKRIPRTTEKPSAESPKRSSSDRQRITKKKTAQVQSPSAGNPSIQPVSNQGLANQADTTNTTLAPALIHQPSSSAQSHQQLALVQPPPYRASLRTATRKSGSVVDTARKPGESPQDHHLRTTHNIVEQKYRHRVQTGYENLIEVLPNDSSDEEGAGSNGTGKQSRRWSKADVLAKTKKVIIKEERENRRLKKEVADLKAKLAAINKLEDP